MSQERDPCVRGEDSGLERWHGTAEFNAIGNLEDTLGANANFPSRNGTWSAEIRGIAGICGAFGTESLPRQPSKLPSVRQASGPKLGRKFSSLPRALLLSRRPEAPNCARTRLEENTQFRLALFTDMAGAVRVGPGPCRPARPSLAGPRQNGRKSTGRLTAAATYRTCMLTMNSGGKCRPHDFCLAVACSSARHLRRRRARHSEFRHQHKNKSSAARRPEAAANFLGGWLAFISP